MTRHRCLYRGCPVLIADDRIACDLHWLGLPEGVRDRMWDTLTACGQASDEYGDAVGVAVALLRHGAGS